ncbi:MAG: hypothetical protein NZ750_12530 [Anaerolineae bacterium]|nr:hypothetical protein [Anaerolineae bacterium]MDW8173603.1 hypothetical protein [Anaerolineae bacterium]
MFSQSQADKVNGDHPHLAEDEARTQDSVPFTDAERNAMRAYLQRMEVRMSSLHRVATAFVGGAGLLLLTPIFFKEVVDGLIVVVLTNLTLPFDQFTPLANLGLSLLLFGALGYLIVLSLSIPMYSLYLLIKDIVHFYFTIYSPGFSSELVTPSFSLAAAAFSPDESPRAKDEVLRYQYTPKRMDFMLPFSEAKRRAYLDDLYEATNGAIIPNSRAQAMRSLQTNLSEVDVRRFNTALGLARMLDRPLVEEVAVTEMLLVRNIIYLRRLVLRYVKALSMFLWTTLISFLMLPFLKDERLPVFVIFGSGYLVWSLGVLPIIRQPLHWIYRHRHDEAVAAEHVDEQLIVLERRVEIFCQMGIAAAALAFALSFLTL